MVELNNRRFIGYLKKNYKKFNTRSYILSFFCWCYLVEKKCNNATMKNIHFIYRKEGKYNHHISSWTYFSPCTTIKHIKLSYFYRKIIQKKIEYTIKSNKNDLKKRKWRLYTQVHIKRTKKILNRAFYCIEFYIAK